MSGNILPIPGCSLAVYGCQVSVYGMTSSLEPSPPLSPSGEHASLMTGHIWATAHDQRLDSAY